MNLKKKENIIIIVILVVMLIAIIGVSYAAFSFGQVGNVPNKITTGSITMTYTETDNTISLSNALPTRDATGTTRLKDGEYFDFNVSSEITGEVNINYEISAKEVGNGTIDGSNIKLYLTKLNGESEEQLMSPETYNEESTSNTFTGRPSGEMSLCTSSMNSSESNDYRLRMYVTEEYNPQGDGGGLTFKVQVNVYGKDRVAEPVSDLLLANIPEENQFDDGTDTFITGEDPNNYIWYSGKLWRAVSVNNEAKTTKLVTQWNISSIYYNENGNTAFEGSYMESWLNDTTVDGFLGNLREPEKYIVTDAKWNATEDATSLGSITRPSDDGAIVEDAVGLINMYEYQSSYHGTTYSSGYLSNGLNWYSLTPYSSSYIRTVTRNGYVSNYGSPTSMSDIRPSINLKSNVNIVNGDGTIENPYRIEGDNDTNLSGILLKDRYSGEYIQFGIGENNLYRIVSHENGTGTKIVSAEPLKNLDTGTFIESAFGSNAIFSSANTVGSFLNGEYLTSYVENNYANMIEDDTTWYLGPLGESSLSYKLAKYKDISMSDYTTSTNAKVGLLRIGELMLGQFDRVENNTGYWTLTNGSGFVYLSLDAGAGGENGPSASRGIKPALNLKSNVVITGGIGTKNNPFTIKLAD